MSKLQLLSILFYYNMPILKTEINFQDSVDTTVVIAVRYL